MHQLKTKMQEQLERIEQQLVESELRLREMNQQLRDLQVQIREKDRATVALQERLGITAQQVGELEEQLTRKDREKNELERFFSQTEIPVIALDVARRLNYLHQKHPIPILHRDINSVNVLLWRQGTQWRA